MSLFAIFPMAMETMGLERPRFSWNVAAQPVTNKRMKTDSAILFINVFLIFSGSVMGISTPVEKISNHLLGFTG